MLSFNNPMEHEHNKGCFPPERPRYTHLEEANALSIQMKETIDRLLKWERRTQAKVDDLLSHVASDNVIFKNTMRDSWTTFLEQVKSEVNLFESNVDSTVSLWKSDIESNYATLSEDTKNQITGALEEFNKKVSDFESAYNEAFTTLNANINDRYDSFVEAVNGRIDNNNATHEHAFADYQQKLTTEINMFEQTINTAHETFTESIQNTVNVFKETWEHIMTERLASQDAKLDDAELYMRTNLTATVTTLIGDMQSNGEFAEIIEGEVFNSLQEKIEGTTVDYHGATGDGVTDDTEAFQRAVDHLNENGGGTLTLKQGAVYYLGTKANDDCFVKLYPNISIEGNGATIKLDNNSSTDVSGIFKCENIENATYSNITFDTSGIDLVNDTDFYDCFYLRYLGSKYINVHFKGIKTLGKAYQMPINFTVYNEDETTNFGYGVSVVDCELYQTSYPSCIHNLKYEGVVWNVDLNALRPEYLNGEAQTPFKITGKSGFVKQIEMNNCTVNITGNTNPCVLFEIMRGDVKIDNLVVNNTSNVNLSANVRSSTTKDKYGASDKTTSLSITNSTINYSVIYGELADVTIDNCVLDCQNVLYSSYNESNKQSSLDDARGVIKVNNSTLKQSGSSGRFHVDSGYSDVILNNCIINYDRAKCTQGGFQLSGSSKLKLMNCVAVINGNGSAYLLNVAGADELIIDGLMLCAGDYSGESAESTFYIAGEVDTISIKNYMNKLRPKGQAIIKTDGATIINRYVELEGITLVADGKDYALTVVDGSLQVTEL